jgi:hypothetical protein
MATSHDAEDGDEERHHHEGVGAAKREADDPHDGSSVWGVVPQSRARSGAAVGQARLGGSAHICWRGGSPERRVQILETVILRVAAVLVAASLGRRIPVPQPMLLVLVGLLGSRSRASQRSVLPYLFTISPHEVPVFDTRSSYGPHNPAAGGGAQPNPRPATRRHRRDEGDR